MAASLSGNLEDISIIDALQVLGLAGKSGTLRVECGSSHATVGFADGRIAGAAIQPRLCYMTDIMIERGQLDEASVREALAIQRRQGDQKKPIGGILLDMGVVTANQIEDAFRYCIQSIIAEIAKWTDGKFSFEQGDPQQVDDLLFLPEPMRLKHDLQFNPQELLLEAMRLQDDAQRSEASADACKPVPALPGAAEMDEALREVTGKEERCPLILITPDAYVRNMLKQTLRQSLFSIHAPHTVREACQLLKDLSPHYPVVVLDTDLTTQRLAVKEGGVEVAQKLWQCNRKSSLITFGLLSDPGALDLLLSCDVRFHLPRPTALLTGDAATNVQFVKTLAHVIERIALGRKDVEGGDQAEADFWSNRVAGVYSALTELRHSGHSITVSLDLMRFVASHVERAILFLVAERELIGLGAFGLESTKATESVSKSLAKFRVPIVQGSAVSELIRNRAAVQITRPSEDPMLGELFRVFGPPARLESLLLPLVVSDRTISIIYADNGDRSERLCSIELLGILTEHAGLLLENLLLRRKIGSE